MTAISIIIPTLNEAGNIDPLIERIFSVLRKHSIFGEIIVVDDGSQDGTREKVKVLSKRYPIKLKCRDNKRGLASAVIEGAHIAENQIAVVMDGDFSHAPEDIPRLLSPVLAKKCDVSIGSRYAPGGSTTGWPLRRKIASRLASVPAQVVTGVEDPLSGFFAVSRSKLLALRPDVPGYKICLELLLGQYENLNVVETPIVFRDRISGTSKMAPAVVKSYFSQLAKLCGISFTAAFWSLFGRLLLAGAAADLLLYFICISQNQSLFASHFTALIASMGAVLIAVYVLHPENTIGKRRLVKPSLILWTLFLFTFRTGVFMFFQNSFWTLPSTWLPAFLASVFSAGAIAGFAAIVMLAPRHTLINKGLRRRLMLLGVIVTSLSFRFLFAGGFELLQEEAYYWNYAQHLDIGYLDHPPMVAILIELGTALFGNSEFGVRVGAQLCWFVATIFAYLYARDISTRDNALQAAAIMSVLPSFFIFGLVMTPDAPLIACWAGTLFFARRALVDTDVKSWLGVGVFLGLGLFSKYTIGLLGLAIAVFLIVDSSSRRQLLKPHPYIAAIIALLIFSPVIAWNMQHDWVSFLFQTQGRLTSSSEFSLHELLVSSLILLSPVGFFAALSFLFGRKRFVDSKKFTTRQYSFAFIATIVPLTIFIIFSLTKEVKLNWTSPIWLALIPFMAVTFSEVSCIFKARTCRRLLVSWKSTILFFLLAYGGCLQYFSFGLPGVPYPSDGPLLGWQGLAEQVDFLAESIEKETGYRPAIVGMDQYKTASGLAFYRTILFEEGHNAWPSHPLTETLGRSVLGREAVMYGYWSSSLQNMDMPLIVLSPDREDLDMKWVRIKSENFSKINILETFKNNRAIGPVYYRIINTPSDPNDKLAILSSPSADG